MLHLWGTGIDIHLPVAIYYQVRTTKLAPCRFYGHKKVSFQRKKYSHTIDPRTGYPVDHSLLSATIVAPDAVSADAYATYCMVVGLEEAKEFISSRPDLDGCLIYDDDGVFRTWCSEGFVLEEQFTSRK